MKKCTKTKLIEVVLKNGCTLYHELVGHEFRSNGGILIIKEKVSGETIAIFKDYFYVRVVER